MDKQRVVLTFSAATVEEPIMYKLIREHDLLINILRAEIDPGEGGRLLVELAGSTDNLLNARDYLQSIHVTVQPLSDKVSIDRDRCVDCGACTAVCLTRALSLDADDVLTYNADRCVLCELCMESCPTGSLATVF